MNRHEQAMTILAQAIAVKRTQLREPKDHMDPRQAKATNALLNDQEDNLLETLEYLREDWDANKTAETPKQDKP